MDLTQALRLGTQPRLALVGAGGKTTALFGLARQLLLKAPGSHTVLVSATTHLGLDQTRLADRHFFVGAPQEMEALLAALPAGVVLFTGPPQDDGRTAGLDPGSLDALHLAAEAHGLPLLLEADGSRRLPLKAPAAHEPALPPWVDTVVVVAGLSGLGRPLTAEFVHRPEIFGSLAGLQPGERVTPQALGRVLAHPDGGLKNIPDQARRVALLNQADSPELQAAALGMAESLLPAYAAVVIARLERPGDTDEPEVAAVKERVAGILLAAGESRRLGQPKQLLPWRGQPLVRHVAQTALRAGLLPVVVVTGAHSEQVCAALDGLPLNCVVNPDWQAGQSTSLAAGLRALPAETGAAVFLLSDQPQVSPLLVRSLVDLHARSLSPLTAPQAGGRRANPVLFDRQTFPDLLALTGDTGGRALFSRYPVAWLPWHDESLLLDVDTPEDYARLLEL